LLLAAVQAQEPADAPAQSLEPWGLGARLGWLVPLGGFGDEPGFPSGGTIFATYDAEGFRADVQGSFFGIGSRAWSWGAGLGAYGVMSWVAARPYLGVSLGLGGVSSYYGDSRQSSRLGPQFQLAGGLEFFRAANLALVVDLRYQLALCRVFDAGGTRLASLQHGLQLTLGAHGRRQLERREANLSVWNIPCSFGVDARESYFPKIEEVLSNPAYTHGLDSAGARANITPNISDPTQRVFHKSYDFVANDLHQLDRLTMELMTFYERNGFKFDITNKGFTADFTSLGLQIEMSVTVKGYARPGAYVWYLDRVPDTSGYVLRDVKPDQAGDFTFDVRLRYGDSSAFFVTYLFSEKTTVYKRYDILRGRDIEIYTEADFLNQAGITKAKLEQLKQEADAQF
jgi:hypothetical protein